MILYYSMLICKDGNVTLKGITLKGSFDLFNPNENLAVVFQIIPSTNIQLQVEPKRGIIMQTQTKRIKVYIPDQERDRAIQTSWINQYLIVNCTMKTQYNRKMFQQLQLRGWNKIKDSVEEINLPIILNRDAIEIRSQIRNQVSNSYSKTFPSRVSASNTSEKFRSISRKKMNKKLDKQLDYLFDHVSNNEPMMESKAQNVRYYQDDIIRSKPVYLLDDKQKFLKIENSFTSKQPLNSPRIMIPQAIRPPMQQSQKNSKLIELLLLAALAGFFAALGSNFRYAFSS